MDDATGQARVNNPIIEQARKDWPAMFQLIEIDKLSGNVLKQRTIHNKKSMGKIPSECFTTFGNRCIVHRDNFLKWWETERRTNSRTVTKNP